MCFPYPNNEQISMKYKKKKKAHCEILQWSYNSFWFTQWNDHFTIKGKT